jgi:glycosyltransferase involved in cell wall biosynthesis
VKVLFTSPALFGEAGVYGGGERYATELARAVAEKLGSATLYAAGERDADHFEGKLHVVTRRAWLAVRGQPLNPLPRGLWRFVRKADVVHCLQRHIVLTSAALALGRLRGIPRFVTELGGGGWDITAYVDTSSWWTGFLHLSRYAAEVEGRADHPTDAILYGGSADPVEPVPGGEDVLFVGRLLAHKGVDVLLEAALPDWPTVVCGAPLDERYLAELRALTDGKQVRFELAADDRALEGLYRRAAVVAVPSVYVDRYGRSTRIPELLGLVAIEAAARGLPVVASRAASLPEIVEDGVTGYLVPPGDVAALRERIGELLKDPARRVAMGRAALARVAARFTWSEAADVAIAAYRRAIGSPRDAGHTA